MDGKTLYIKGGRPEGGTATVMEPLRITIPGDYWDCQLWKGRLYLWRMDGSLAIYNWESLVGSLAFSDAESAALSHAFIDGDQPSPHEHGPWTSLMATKHWILTNQDLQHHCVGLEDNPFRDLPVDTGVSGDVLFAATNQGLQYVSVPDDHAQIRTPVLIFDAPIYSVRAHQDTVSAAAGDQGLFELYAGGLKGWNGWRRGSPKQSYRPVGVEYVGERMARLSHDHCSVANWSFASLYCSSYVEDGYMVAFKWQPEGRGVVRVFDDLIPQEKIFGRFGVSWGTYDKLYCAVPGGLRVVDYRHPNHDHPHGRFGEGRFIRFLPEKGDIIGGGVARFGVIIECEHALVVKGTEDDFFNVMQEPVRWRIYPNLRSYQNQLHVILDDCLEIFSFDTRELHDGALLGINKHG